MRSRGLPPLLSGLLRPPGLLLPVLSGLLLVLCFPPFHLLVPSFIALVPLALYLRALPDGRTGSRRAFRAGTVTGLVYFGLLLHWLIPALLWLNPLGPVLYLVVVIFLGGLLGMATWSAHRLEHEGVVPAVLALPLAWVAIEWLRGHLPGGLAFPWLGLGSSLTAYPELVGIAEVVGARGVSFWLVLGNALLAEAVWTGAPRRSRVRAVGVLAVVLSVPVTWGLWRAATLPVAPVASLAVAQTWISAETKDEPVRALRVTREQLRRMGFGDGARSFGGSDLLIWPETTVPFPPSARSDAVHGMVEGAAAEEAAPLLFGALEVGNGAADGVGHQPGGALYNSAFLFTPSAVGAGELRSVYRKRFLVPVVERAPRLLPAFLPLPEVVLEGVGGPGSGGSGEGGVRGEPSPADGELTPGEAGHPVALPWGSGAARRSSEEREGAFDGTPGVDAAPSVAGGPRFGILICFESAFSEASRAYRNAGADFLVNVTNDVWFGEGTWLPSRAGAEQHAAHVVMRAVENRMGVARSANGGPTFFVDPVGRIHGRAPEGEAAVTVGTVVGSGVRTLYARTGDWVGAGSVAAVILLLLAGAARNRPPEISSG